MPTDHQVRSGDCISSIAEQYGFFPETLWNHAGNKSLAARREDGNQLVPGDLVKIPDLTEGTHDGAPEKRHRFRRKGVPAELTLRILYLNEPRADTPYVMQVEGRVLTGHTDADGYLTVTIHPNDRHARLVVGTPKDMEQEYDIRLGRLEPIETVAGVQARLHNLGFPCGTKFGEMNDETTAAIRLFQQFIEHDHPTGELDQKTRDELVARHDE